MPSALTVLALSVYIVVMGRQLLESLLAMMELPMKLLSTPYAEAAPRAAEATFHIAVSIVARSSPRHGRGPRRHLGQVGILFAFKGAMPKLENISPSKWFQKVFSMRNLVEFLKNIIKVTVLGVTVWVVMRDHLPTLFAIQRGQSGRVESGIGAQGSAAHGCGRLLRHRRRGLPFPEMAVRQEPYDVER